MRHPAIILLLLITTALFGQTPTEADKVRETMKGASISKPIKKNRTLFFSDTKKQDTIILTVPAGLISKSSSLLTIKSFDNKTIFNESFRTVYFIRGVFEPDTIPQGGQEVYEAYMDKYITSLTKANFEDYSKNKIDAFLKDVTVSKTELTQAKLYGTVVDKDLYKTIAANPNSKVIWVPCFECDEGVRYFAYSPKKAKAIKFLEAD
jgi:hypothetical protein